jgi:hypothetical protein
MGRYVSTITYDHNENLSCVVRNFRAIDDRDKILKGFNISVKIVFESFNLDQDLTNVPCSLEIIINDYLRSTFHNTTIISDDDPAIDEFNRLCDLGIINLKTMPGVGIEKFAEHVFLFIQNHLNESNISRLIIKTVEVREHSGRSSLYIA